MLELIRRSFAGRRVFLTGHTGFKGSWLSLWLTHLGAEVFGYALAPDTTPDLFSLAGIDRRVDATLGDIRDADALAAALARARPDIVLHLAAQPLVRLSYREPVATFATNVMGTAHLLDAVRRVDTVRAVVVVSSDKCYDNRPGKLPAGGFRESDAMGGADPYSASKGCTELVVEAWRSSFFPPERFTEHGVALASARAGNVIGGGDWAEDRLIPDMVRAFGQGRSALIRNPAAVRPWQHVLEPLWGYLLLTARLLEAGATHASGWNFGPDNRDALPVAEVADALCRHWGDDARWHTDTPPADAPHEAALLRLDCTRARQDLGWQPVCPLPEALARTARWYRDMQQGADAATQCLAQIAAQEAAIAALGSAA
ncbi:CDP-glucose 4,6-dehydratase [Denitromonas iodatirespirans]|uniref:CDP-glucose 4,6-dehydratase n=1 Tax=Denitromonas iodatirespirans TaxID=2795389 RepID=A0A944DN69_DENI1|nr:CDP-glucose 4,6-dehydratase [Denitromonas iodatirespirans]MBT0961714.1 CDP-glucose 4,6-dehydratase [Denitromonas iodatirespirans]